MRARQSTLPLLLFFALAPTSAAVAARRPTARVVAPGRCVAIPTVSWRVDRTATQMSPRDPSRPPSADSAVSMSTSAIADLDGDGTLDVLVPEPTPTQCNNEYAFALYLRRGSCGHRVGTIRGALQIDRISAAPRANGLPELVTRIERSAQSDPRVPAQRETETITYRFDGSRYREHAREVTRAVCHHCSRVACRNTRIQQAP